MNYNDIKSIYLRNVDNYKKLGNRYDKILDHIIYIGRTVRCKFYIGLENKNVYIMYIDYNVWFNLL